MVRKLKVRMSLVDHWATVVRRAWSVRLSLLSALLSAAEFALPLLPDSVVDTIGRGRFAGAAFVISIAAGIARVVAQPRMRK